MLRLVLVAAVLTFGCEGWLAGRTAAQRETSAVLQSPEDIAVKQAQLPKREPPVRDSGTESRPTSLTAITAAAAATVG